MFVTDGLGYRLSSNISQTLMHVILWRYLWLAPHCDLTALQVCGTLKKTTHSVCKASAYTGSLCYPNLHSRPTNGCRRWPITLQLETPNIAG